MKEIRIHQKMNHPNIVAFDHYFEDGENFYILLELCQNRSLTELIRRRGRLTELEVKSYARQILSAIKYIHSSHTIHREYS